MVSPATISGLIVLLATHPSNRPVIQGYSETSAAKGCQERIDSYSGKQLFGEDVLTYFALPTRTARTIASIGAPWLVGLSGSVPSQAQDELSSAERCLSANFNVSLGAQLSRKAARLNSGEPLNIVAIVSPSTVGLWVLRSAADGYDCTGRALARVISTSAH